MGHHFEAQLDLRVVVLTFEKKKKKKNNSYKTTMKSIISKIIEHFLELQFHFSFRNLCFFMVWFLVACILWCLGIKKKKKNDGHAGL
jgi:cbb3-type cytochrome oxidase subunit 3